MATRSSVPKARTPWGAIASLVMAVLYGASPIDLIPDLIPLLGWSDDVVIVGMLLLLALRLFLKARGRDRRRELQPVAWRPKS